MLVGSLLLGKVNREMISVRESTFEDLPHILELYLHLHETAVPEWSDNLSKTWARIIDDENHHLIVCEEDGKIASSCVCVIIPNLTRGVRPYAFVRMWSPMQITVARATVSTKNWA